MSMFNNVKRIIFDLDNTLIKHNFEEECTEMTKYLGIQDVLEFKKQLSNLFSHNFDNVKWIAMTEEYYVELVEEYIPLLRENGKNGKDFLEALDYLLLGELMEGAKELLEYLQDKGYQIVALTNWFYIHQVNLLKRLGILHYFEKIYAWDEYYAKPNRLAMIRAIDCIEPTNCIMIGDDPIGDVSLAKRCSIKAIGYGIDYTKFANCNKIKRADVNVQNLLDIKKYL